MGYHNRMPKEAMHNRVTGAIRHFTRDIWLADPGSKGGKTLALSRWAYLVGYGFFKDQCHLRATVLAYVTILSVAPLLAVGFSISKALGLQDSGFIRELLIRFSAGREGIVDNIVAYINNTGVGTLGAVGTLALFTAAFSLLNTVEGAFNSIWGVKKGRNLWRKFTDYFSVLLVSPVLVILAVSVTVSLESEGIVNALLELPGFTYLYWGLIKLAPFLFVWLAFLFLYVFIPNTRVRLPGAAAAAVIAGSLWQVAQMYYVGNQADVITKSNLIYGSFAQFPLFLIWLYVSWVIVLLGGEIAYALQNVSTFRADFLARHASPTDRHKLAMVLLVFLVDDFERGHGGRPSGEISEKLEVPGRLVNQLADELIAQEYVVRGEREGETVFVLARDPESIRVVEVFEALSQGVGATGIPLPGDYALLDELLQQITLDARASQANLSLQQLYDRMCGEKPSGDTNETCL